MKYILTLLLALSLFTTCLAQETKKIENTLYIVDSIPIIDDPDKNSGTLHNEDIDHIQVVTNADQIKAAGYPTIDKIIYVTTKEYNKRSDELKKIPSTK